MHQMDSGEIFLALLHCDCHEFAHGHGVEDAADSVVVITSDDGHGFFSEKSYLVS